MDRPRLSFRAQFKDQAYYGMFPKIPAYTWRIHHYLNPQSMQCLCWTDS